jgi:hypothetical protein
VLTKVQQRELVKELKPFSGTPITIDFSFSDGEARSLTGQLLAAFIKSGWKVVVAPPTPAGAPSDAENTLGVTVSTFGELKRGGSLFHIILPLQARRFLRPYRRRDFWESTQER